MARRLSTPISTRPRRTARWTTAIIPGFGLLGDQFDEPMLVRWTIADGVARSPDLPGVAIAGRPFIGIEIIKIIEQLTDGPARHFVVRGDRMIVANEKGNCVTVLTLGEDRAVDDRARAADARRPAERSVRGRNDTVRTWPRWSC